MKSMMKKALSVIIALAMLLVPMSVFAAELGEYDNPYQLTTTSGPRFPVSVAPGAYVYVQVDNSDNSTVSVEYATNANYEIYYCRQTYTAETESGNNTTTFNMVADVDMFTVYNTSKTDYVVLYPILTAGEPVNTTGTREDPEEVTLEDPRGMGFLSANMQKELAAGNQGYYYTVTAPDDGAISVSVSAYDADDNEVGWMFNTNNTTKGTYGDNILSTNVDPWGYTEYCEVSAGDVVTVFVTTFNPNDPWNAPAATVYTNFGFTTVGSFDYPDDAKIGSNIAETNGSGYNYTWTATEEGTVTVTMGDNNTNGWQYNINVDRDGDDYTNDTYGDNHTHLDNPVVSSESVEVKAGDVVSICVNTYNPTVWQVPGTVNWTLSFEAGSTGDNGQGGDIGGGDDGSEGDDVIGGEEQEVNYVNSSDYLMVGENACIVNTGYEYTVYTFEPTEDGKYTFTSNNSVMGIVSNNGMWITTAPSAETVNANEFSWECEDVGQSIWVAVKADANIANITITREDLDKSDEVQWTIYENITTPKAFEYDGDVDELMYVDTFEDDFVNSAVLGKDGYYHLNTAEGPILYVNLNDSLMSLVKIVSTGKLSAVYYGDNGEVTKKVDYTLALLEYLGVKDIAELEAKQIGDNPVIYPLTEDLITMFKEVGNTNKWYGEKGVVGGTAEDAWMFACYYSPTADDGGNDNIGGNTGDNVGDNTGDVSDPKIPNTDNEVLGVAMAMMVATATVGAAIVIRKTKRVK